MYLREEGGDYITIISNEEIIRISLFHIRNISYGVKLEVPKEEEYANASSSNQSKDKNSSSKNDSKNDSKKES